jgi:predicted YcjX-like family ATPase
VETDPEGRFHRYKDAVGKGRFKNVFKAFDSQIGIDVAWSKINADSSLLQLTDEQLSLVVKDIQKGLQLEHPNIIKCFKVGLSFNSNLQQTLSKCKAQECANAAFLLAVLGEHGSTLHCEWQLGFPR